MRLYGYYGYGHGYGYGPMFVWALLEQLLRLIVIFGGGRRRND